MSSEGEPEFGQLERVGGLSVVHYVRRLSHPPEKVWRALTEPQELAGWFPTTIEGELAVGAPLQFAFREMEIEPMGGEMLAFEPPSLLELRWGEDILRFALEPDGIGSILRLTVTMVEHGKAARDATGWHICLEQLSYVTNGATPPWKESDRWREVNRGYVERMGPEASAIGPPEEWERVNGTDRE